MEPRSPLDSILARADFKPFAGPRAFRVLSLAREMLKIPPVLEGDVLKAVSSLGVLLETEVAMILAMQDALCIRCGECCRGRESTRFTKQELQAAADHLRRPYKKLKEETRARPMGDGTHWIRQPCPFLSGDLCGVYPVRPASCRGYPASVLLPGMARGGGEDACPIDDQLLAEIVVKRVSEERLFRENPEELGRMAEQKRRDLASLAELPTQERLRRLTAGYAKYLRREAADAPPKAEP